MSGATRTTGQISRMADWFRRRPAWTGLAAWAGLTAFYILTGPGNHSEADDAFWYAHDVETAPWSSLFDPLHALYLPLMRTLWLVARALGVAQRSFPVMVVFGAGCAAAAVVVAFLLLRRRFDLSSRWSLLGAGILAFSYGFWRYAAEAEVYSFALLLVLVFLVVALRRHEKPRDTALAVGVGVLAVGGHVLAIFPVLGSIPLYLLLSGQLRRGVIYTASCGLLVLSASYALFAAAGLPDQTYLEYVTRAAPGQTGVAPRPALRNLAEAPVGLGQILLAGNFLLRDDRVYAEFRSRFPNRMIEDERLTAVSAPAAMAAVAPVTFAVTAGLLLTLAVLLPLGIGAAVTESRIAPLVPWALAHAGLLVVLGGSAQLEGWFLGLIPLWLLAVLALYRTQVRWNRLGRALGAALLAALLLHNFVAGMASLADAGNDRNVRKAAWLATHANPGDLILTADSPGFARFLRYWTPATVLDLQEIPAADLDSVYAAHTASGPDVIYLSGDVFEPPAYFRGVEPERWRARERWAERLRPRAHLVTRDAYGAVYRLAGP